MSEIIVSFGLASQNSTTRNVFEDATLQTALSGLVDTQGQTTGIGAAIVAWPSAAGNNNLTIGAGNTQGTGDAAWVEPWMNEAASPDFYEHTMGLKFTGLDPAKQYQVETYGIASTSTAELASEVFGADKLTHAIAGNTSLTNRHAPVSPNASNEIEFSVYREATTDNLFFAAFRLLEIGPEVTLDQTELTPGGTISGSYSNFSAAPTTLTVTDAENNSITVSVTVDDVAKTFTGTMPTLPSSGSTVGIQFGANTVVELT